MKLENRVAIVTGGSGGIGYAVCEKFLEEGAKVILASIDQPSADLAAEELKKKYPNAYVRGIAPKLSSFQETQAEFKKIYDELGRIDILVNNAGCSDNTHLDKYTEEIYDRVFDLNIKAVFSCSRAVIEYMEQANSGVIINTSSVVSVCGQPNGTAYPSSKFAVNGFTLSLAREVAKYNIRVNAVAPGVTNTTMMKSLPEKYKELAIQQIPMKRIGEAEDVANAILFLASDDASYISGTVLNVDGLVRF